MVEGGVVSTSTSNLIAHAHTMLDTINAKATDEHTLEGGEVNTL